MDFLDIQSLRKITKSQVQNILKKNSKLNEKHKYSHVFFSEVELYITLNRWRSFDSRKTTIQKNLPPLAWTNIHKRYPGFNPTLSIYQVYFNTYKQKSSSVFTIDIILSRILNTQQNENNH